ncbi:MAG TPA: PfkB family carbohydrate kinase, partial [Candidatus Ozemobacteraceae bacterium]|nr:PfkB family carbohydrate kinase [Candidatus Ozemobacteraceae bacterium]
MLKRTRLQEILQSFTRLELAVLGDVMLDEFLWGKVDRISPEAPVPIVQVKNETSRPGGAANVAANIVSLGARAHIVGVVGDDGAGRKLRESLESEKIATDGLVIDPERRTTLKTRIIGHKQQMIRIDRESSGGIGEACGELIHAAQRGAGGIQRGESEIERGAIMGGQQLVAHFAAGV